MQGRARRSFWESVLVAHCEASHFAIRVCKVICVYIYMLRVYVHMSCVCVDTYMCVHHIYICIYIDVHMHIPIGARENLASLV